MMGALGFAGAVGLCLFVVGCSHVRPIESDRTLFPAQDAPNAQQLVSVHWLKDLLDFHASGNPSERPPSYDNEHVVVLEASWATLEQARDYRAGHVPGAIHLNTDEFENGSPRWRLRGVDALHDVIGSKGIGADTTVIVYSEQLIAAARVWWVLQYAGVADVRLLDGGFRAWKAAGYPVETTIQIPEPVTFQAAARTDWIATTEYVSQSLAGENVWFGDVRSNGEFLGKKSGYAYLDAKGRIPGAIHLEDADGKSLPYSERNGRLRPPQEIRALWLEAGITLPNEARQDSELILYCGGGWRSSLAFFYAKLLGFEKVRNYSDGWSGWSTRYQPDAEAKGSTPGWRQEATGNPIEL